MKGKIFIFKDQRELAEKFSDLLMEMIAYDPSLQTRDGNLVVNPAIPRLKAAIPRLQRGITSGSSRFDLAISGGSTPQIVFSALATKYADSPLWQKTHFWWVDERMVPPDHPESNFGVANRLLFSKINIPEKNIHRIKGENEPQLEAESYAQQLNSQVPAQISRPVFDLIILGLGDDGHTASIFPDQLELLESDLICAVAHHPVSGQARVTLTGNQINHASEICFLVTGVNKAERLSEIAAGGKKAKPLPASYIHPENGELFWYCDAGAAELLP
ncbi:MAG TPA: 6-phosphogluconolactonase [Prolixibacteraceae bacterium]